MKLLTARPRLVLLLITALILALVLGLYAYEFLRSPEALYREAQNAPTWRADMLYQRLAKRYPQIAEYFQLQEAQRQMPGLDAITALQALISQHPHSPVAYEAYVILARYYASTSDPSASDSYRSALALDGSPALRDEFARYLVESGDTAGAYSEYKRLLKDQPDAFAQMRLYGPDPITIATDLISATYYPDALETLGDLDSGKAVLLRAQAYNGLGRYEDAASQYRLWLQQHPDDIDSSLALGGVYESLGQTDNALALYKSLDDDRARVAEADLIVDTDPKTALDLYQASQDPIAWWKAAGILEGQSQLTDAILTYLRVANAGIYLSDDAAYRILILAKRNHLSENAYAETQARNVLETQGQIYLGIKSGVEALQLTVAPSYNSSLPDLLEQKVSALEQLGLKDQARRELTLAARFNTNDEVVTAAAQALADRGYAADAYKIAAGLLSANPRRPLAVWQLAYPKPYADAVTAAAKQSQVDPLLVWALMRQESGFDPEALSAANAQGLMQIIPTTRDSIAEQLGEQVPPDAMFNPETNIRFGITYLGSLFSLFHGDQERVIMAYNAGPGTVQAWLTDPRVQNNDDLYRWVGIGATREYLMRVMLDYRRYQALEQLETQVSP
jgi:soluble lytic murein transglycosylase